MPHEQPLSLLAQTRERLRRLGIRAQKRLGQHFLVDGRVLQRIVSSAELDPDDTVIEVGPGLGILTQELAKKARWVIAIEVDPRLTAGLKELLALSTNVLVIQGNILDYQPSVLLAAPKGESPSTYKVVANLPYYITSPVLRHFLEAQLKPKCLVVTIQKEVAQNIVARPGEMSLLAISVQFYGQPTIIDYVPARSFHPSPKVDSAILRIDVHERPPLEVGDRFFPTVRAGFSARRKQLANALAQGLGIVPKEAAFLLQLADIDPRRRAETLSLAEWAKLSQVMQES
ncbi:MAG: ribosomal RNA small subunit methyltransferase A [Chloroflexi bacterium]|nr:ribosomal RNA small subunit methyltransferase A [Chloroflexota bacterium]